VYIHQVLLHIRQTTAEILVMLKYFRGETMSIWLVQKWNDNIWRCRMFEVPIYQQKYRGQTQVQTTNQYLQ